MNYNINNDYKKENLQNSGGSKNENKRKQKVRHVFKPYQRTKKKNKQTMEVIPVVIGALGTILEGLVKGLEDSEIRRQEETIKTIALLRSP